MKSFRIIALGIAFALPGTVAGADISELLTQCQDCHGPGGVSSYDDVPTIAGQKASFIEKSLRSYQVWGRPCVKSEYRFGDTARPRTDMCQIAEGLTIEDITALSQHYGALTFRPATQEFDAGLVSVGAALHEAHCEKCHEQGGAIANVGPILAGQWIPYLRLALKYVPTGEHLVPPLMEKTVADLGKDEIDALMNYYASRQE